MFFFHFEQTLFSCISTIQKKINHSLRWIAEKWLVLQEESGVYSHYCVSISTFWRSLLLNKKAKKYALVLTDANSVQYRPTSVQTLTWSLCVNLFCEGWMFSGWEGKERKKQSKLEFALAAAHNSRSQIIVKKKRRRRRSNSVVQTVKIRKSRGWTIEI